ncbi:hypothetical protein QVN42_05760 [Yersinia nurmii]|uniref:Beta-gamma-crystallin n=1 Tax=Yersinia nurmii TaxID=685706 RepID=A0AAW7JYZ4_9GAMM|nr:hypothetical protein [Yersinia nurmii]MDN0086906.1 hypothetical protein [Yersinia nurmii]CNE29383.1 beta-gamma-crystallin [Yersinia nurmii]
MGDKTKAPLLLFLLSSTLSLAEDGIYFEGISQQGPVYETENRQNEEICFYSKDYFSGESWCLPPNSKLDQESLAAHPNINSIRIPDYTQVTLYQNQRALTLVDSITNRGLTSLLPNKKITHIVTTNKNSPICTSQCGISQKIIIPVNDIYPNHTQEKKGKEKIILLSFAINKDSSFNINVTNKLDITVNALSLIIYSIDNNLNTSFKVSPQSTQLTFLIHFKSQGLEIHYLESTRSQPRYLSPRMRLDHSFLSAPDTEHAIAIYNGNGEKTLLMEHLVMAEIDRHSRYKRGSAGILGCLVSGPLALYNVVIHGRCNQVETAWHSIKSFFAGKDETQMTPIAGNVNPLKPLLNQTNTQPDDTFSLQLTRLDMQLHQQSITLPAVARYCGTTLEYTLSSRYPRQTPPACHYWLASVLQDFTTLFGRSLHTWSTEYLIQIVNGILDRQTIDSDNEARSAVASRPETSQRLIQTIIDSANIYERSQLIDHITDAFHHAILNYANYCVSAHSAALNNSSDSNSSEAETACAAPRDAQDLPLGHYELLLEHYQHQETLPHILRNGAWVVPEERFEIQIFENLSAAPEADQRALHSTLSAWRERYTLLNQVISSYPPEQQELINLGQELNQILQKNQQQSLTGYQNYLWVIVRLNGEIVSLTLADYDGDNIEIADRDSIELALSLTNPLFVIGSNHEGTIRGSGTAGARALAQYMKDKGKKKLFSLVVSKPSAKVKMKVGFRLHTEM